MSAAVYDTISATIESDTKPVYGFRASGQTLKFKGLTNIPMISGTFYTWETAANSWTTYQYVGASNDSTAWANTNNWKIRF